MLLTLIYPSIASFDVSAFTQADLIAVVLTEDSIGKKYLVTGAQCVVTDRFENPLGYGISNQAGLVHIALRSYDVELSSPVIFSCYTPHFEGSEEIDIDERYLKEEITMTPISYYVVK